MFEKSFMDPSKLFKANKASLHRSKACFDLVGLDATPIEAQTAVSLSSSPPDDCGSFKENSPTLPKELNECHSEKLQQSMSWLTKSDSERNMPLETRPKRQRQSNENVLNIAAVSKKLATGTLIFSA
uniref:Uncharacterized protein n=1 Tax=Plectus sambesii TaxID=2011161 RepID=A0A914X8I9_9BILA